MFLLLLVVYTGYMHVFLLLLLLLAVIITSSNNKGKIYVRLRTEEELFPPLAQAVDQGPSSLATDVCISFALTQNMRRDGHEARHPSMFSCKGDRVARQAVLYITKHILEKCCHTSIMVSSVAYPLPPRYREMTRCYRGGFC